MRRLVAPALGLLLTPIMASDPAARAQAPAVPRGYVAHRASHPLAIDGKLDDPAWRDAAWTEPFEDIEGSVRPKPRFTTRAKMLWDDRYFYIGARLDEPHVWGTLTKHDCVIFQNNDFEVFIDPDGDNHEYYELEINALNTEWDLFLPKPYRDGGGAVDAWEIPGLKTAVHVEGTLNDPRDEDSAWTVEIAIPWKALGEFAHRPAPPKDGDQWRVNFSRVEWRHELDGRRYRRVPGTKEDNWVWSPQGVIDMHRPEHWGIVEFSSAAPGTVKVRPDPTLTVRSRLMQVYHAQKAYREKHGRWADRIEDLRLPEPPAGLPRCGLSFEPRPDGYLAVIRPLDEAMARAIGSWSVREDSRLQRR
ncbi:carbohydrate-binding family 9-like protein [Aquisphaera insulae]|uniref:carbohydrate-binding family 9-like protein n=1 Tax=Aquisphaera insulae TaxID=2712864 RepID=UPI00196B2FCA|nr:carbohydrate-binding family 9-like protein [Aquisphaera insulae]